MNKALNFEIKTRLDGTLARTGVILTPHGQIKTPAYIAIERFFLKNPEKILTSHFACVLIKTYGNCRKQKYQILTKFIRKVEISQ